MGDLNVNSLDYDNNESVKKIFNMIFQCGFLPLIQRATRVTRTTPTAIDLWHKYLIIFLYNKKTKITERDFNEENIQNFHFLLENIN